MALFSSAPSVLGLKNSGVQAEFPISRLPVHVHDGYDPDAIRFIQVDDRVGEHI